MKVIAHRGGSCGRENALETMVMSARMGADAVECDVRRTKDGIYVIYHDADLSRLAGEPAAVSEITYAKMQAIMESSGQKVLTFAELAAGYREKTPILLHIKLEEYDTAFAKYVAASGLPLIPGVVSLAMLKCFSAYFPPESILAFMPDYTKAEAFYAGGAGILRLWEQWLDTVTPADIKKICPGAQVFVMACNVKEKGKKILPENMDGSRESLDRCCALGADGVLLNDIEMAVKWRKEQG